MISPNAPSLLRVWEEGRGLHPLRRALALLDVAAPDHDRPWRVASIGRRDAQLLELYEEWFGSQLQTITRCPSCDESLESNFSVADVLVRSSEPAPDALFLSTQGFELTYRLPSSDDLLQATSTRDTDSGVAELLQRCVIQADFNGERRASHDLPAALVAELSAAMAAHDPGGDVQINLKCPRCAHRWSVIFDIVSHLWSALEDWAQRTLAEVHLLACAYGWSEREILELSATRRRHYVELLQA